MRFCKTCARFFEDDALLVCPEDGSPLVPFKGTVEGGDPLLGRLVDGRFLVHSLIGRGGMASVYRATQTSVNRDVALKVIRSDGDEDSARRFMLEARMTSALRSAHTVTMYDFGQDDDGLLYLALELLRGESLAERLQREGAQPWPFAARVIADVADSLHEAHGKGIVHRDLKPANVFLGHAGSSHDFVKVLDFGIAKLRKGGPNTDITGTGAVLGTPRYMSPEQARGEPLDARADLYALGVVLYELLAGVPPFAADAPVAVVMAHCQEPVPDIRERNPRLDCPDALIELVSGLLEKDRDLRLASAAEVRERVLALLGGAQASTPPPVRGGEAPVVAPLVAPGVLDTGATTGLREVTPVGGTDLTQAQEAARERPRRRGWWLALAALFVLALVGPLFVDWGAGAGTAAPAAAPVAEPVSEPAPVAAAEPVAEPESVAVPEPVAAPEPVAVTEPESEPVAVTEPESEPVADPRKLTVESVPPGAVVLDAEGRRVGRTPLELTVPEQAERYTLRRSGFRTARLTLAPDSAELEPIKLRRKKRKPKVTHYRDVDDLP